MRYRTGVHTVEIKTSKYINDRELFQPVKGKRYKLNVEARASWPCYQTIDRTEQILHDVLEEIGECDTGRITRADYRLDSYTTSYEEALPLMTALVNVVAYQTGQMNRVQYTAHEADRKTHSVRCMPDEHDDKARFGIEFYDKAYQRGDETHGKARLELRSLNLQGGNLKDTMKAWETLLKSIDRSTYLNTLHLHAQKLATGYKQNECKESFIRRMIPCIIGREEEALLRKIIGSSSNKRQCSSLPRWSDIRGMIREIIQSVGDSPESRRKKQIPTA